MAGGKEEGGGRKEGKKEREKETWHERIEEC